LAAAAGAAARAAPPVDPSFAHQNDFTPNQLGPQPQASHQVLQWDARKGRWGLNFDLNQQPNRNADWRDARIGLNYRVAPGLRTGVGVSLGNESPPDVRTFAPEQPAPRVRLETTLKF
jgi:hypothetical protein